MFIIDRTELFVFALSLASLPLTRHAPTLSQQRYHECDFVIAVIHDPRLAFFVRDHSAIHICPYPLSPSPSYPYSYRQPNKSHTSAQFRSWPQACATIHRPSSITDGYIDTLIRWYVDTLMHWHVLGHRHLHEAGRAADPRSQVGRGVGRSTLSGGGGQTLLQGLVRALSTHEPTTTTKKDREKREH